MLWKRGEKISDKRISLLAALISFVGVLVLFLPIVLVSIFQVTSRAETRSAEFEILRVEKIFQNEASILDQHLLDWANRDDTYRFLQDVNKAYIEARLSNESIANLDIDIFFALNRSNEVVYAKYINRFTREDWPLPFDPQVLFREYPVLLQHTGTSSAQRGIIFLPGYPMLVAARPVLTSQKQGPASGTLVWIRLLDAKELEEFSELASRKLSLLPAAHLPDSASELPEPAVLQDRVFVYPRDAQNIVGYKYLKDLNHQSVLVLQVENPRDLYAQGRTTAVIFSGALMILAVLLLGGTYHFTRSFLSSLRTGRKYLQRFQTIVQQSNEAILLVRDDCHILEANPASSELLNWKFDESPAPCLKSLLTFMPELTEPFIREISQSSRFVEFHCVRHDGVPLDVDLSASFVPDSERPAFSLVLHDITSRKNAEMALRASEERYVLAARGVNDGLWDWNLMNNEVYYSPRWKEMLGYREDEIGPLSEEWLNRVHPEDLLSVRAQLSNHLRNRTGNFECEYRIQHKDGNYRWMLARGVAVWDPAGFAKRIAGSQTDIQEQKELEEQLRYDALHDSLTGIGNRTLLIEHLSHVNERKKRKPDLLFALFFLDFDRFKQVNDSLGHHVGDLLLIEASRRLDIGLRTTDTITRFTGPETLARIAGDEFVILLEDFHSLEDVQKVAERVISLLSAPYHIAGQEVILSASVGLVVPEAPYANAEDIIRDADIAMYRAKQMGGAQVIRFNQEMYQGTVAKMQLESDLRKAVERQEFVVHYQPIYTLDNGVIAGFEALVRWNHPERGLLSPADFIQVAEEIGMIVPIGYYVLESACRQMKAWQSEFSTPPGLVISVNLSVRQLINAELILNISAILENSGFDPKRLWLEVTESALLENNEVVLARLNELRSMGIHIEIDDFGTGYSSLSYLQNLPVDGFKIDRSFVRDIQNGGQQIVKTLIELGHSLGLTQVAEGVETENQKDYLKSLACKYAQGYLMSKPVCAEGIRELLRVATTSNAS